MIASLDNPEYPNWPTLLVIGIVLALCALLVLIGSAHHRHRHAQQCVVVVEHRAAQHCVVVVKDRR